MANMGLDKELRAALAKMGFKSKLGVIDPERNSRSLPVVKVAERKDGSEYFEFYSTGLRLVDGVTSDKMLLVEIPAGFRSRNPVRLLLGKDETHLFITRMEPEVESVKQALMLLEPATIKRAREKGKAVKRQGDWFFYPVSTVPRGRKTYKNLHLTGRHIAEEGIICSDEGIQWIYVRGEIRHHQHKMLSLTGWHRAVRNQSRKFKLHTKSLLSIPAD